MLVQHNAHPTPDRQQPNLKTMNAFFLSFKTKMNAKTFEMSDEKKTNNMSTVADFFSFYLFIICRNYAYN